jgi:predicted PurR-regulated permease PerM
MCRRFDPAPAHSRPDFPSWFEPFSPTIAGRRDVMLPRWQNPLAQAITCPVEPHDQLSPRVERNLALAVLVLMLIGCFIIIKPFLSALMWAAVLCFSLWPLQRRLVAWMGNRRTLAALTTTSVIALVLVVPVVVIGIRLAGDARDLTAAARVWARAPTHDPPSWVAKIPLIGGQAQQRWVEFADDTAELIRRLERPSPDDDAVDDLPKTHQAATTAPAGESRIVEALRRLLGRIQTWAITVGLIIGQGVLEIALSVLLTFFLFRDGLFLAERLQSGIARIAGDRGKHLLDLAGKTVRGVVYGILGTAVVQGVLAGIGFLIAGVPGAVLLGLLTFFLSVLPMGPPLVWIPVTIWLFSQGWTGWGIFMLIWGLGVSSVDNVVKPWIISQGSNMPFILIFIGVIGGALAFGLIGVFLGPTLLAVSYKLIEDWFKSHAPAAVSKPGL